LKIIAIDQKQIQKIIYLKKIKIDPIKLYFYFSDTVYDSAQPTESETGNNNGAAGGPAAGPVAAPLPPPNP
jgi:hypothetical protein